ncbi:DNA recombination protein RmuC [Sphingosinicella sp. LHD-64]|uniref:DNA recombination protein RmuC n=1 Tax=Sphingosinicella sp. LHD-64 TaxID=3072139 RepID=UPI002810853A|nr:DNA recombination protein RmuC [Sphingosinicella sp. LHD-64]MDQ8755028.1 DNA recombination protein RmuC [Sphingosinicella sp. LHD-64]
MEPVTVVILALVALIGGLGLGWFAAARQAAPLHAERDDLRTRVSEAEKGHAAAEERARAGELLRMTLTEVTSERDTALRQLSEMQADARNFELRMKELMEAKDALAAQFNEVGSKLLSEAQKQFLERADARFHQASEKSEAQLKALLQPVEATLKRYEDGLKEVEKNRVDQYAGLREAVQLLHTGHTQVRDETRNLVNALRASPKARGRWGEQSLRNVLEQAGLSPHADFQSEVSVTTDDGCLRPDVIVRMPGGRKLIIDAKCSLNAYLDASEEIDEAARAAHLQKHAAAIRTHAQQLGSKNYWEQFGDAADYVVMYIPGEHFLTAALEQDDGLWEWAFGRRVLLATPTNLVAIARTVASVWRQERLAEEAAEIARLGKELHSRLATMGAHVARLGRNLELATGAYNAFVGSLESQVMTQAKRFEALEVSSGAKEIEDLPLIEGAPRPLTKLFPTEKDGQPN